MRVFLLVAFLAVVHGAALDRFLSIKAVSMWPDNNFKRVEDSTPEECAEKCLAGFYPDCKSFRYKVEHRKCDLLAIAPDDEVNVLKASAQGWDFYIMQPDFGKMEDSVDDLTRQLELKNTQIAALTKEKEELSQAVESLEAATNSRAEEVANLKDQLRQKTEELEKVAEEHVQLTNVLEARVAAEKQTIQALEAKVSKLEEELSEMDDDEPRPRHCWDMYKNQGVTTSGVYKIYPFGPKGRAMDVYCLNGWTVFLQRDVRQAAAENFDRNWTEYQNGFGFAGKEFWLGLEALSALTGSEQMRLQVEMKFSFAYYARVVSYNGFRVYDESQNYKLATWGFQGRTLLDFMRTGNGFPFSTKDKDHSPNRVCTTRNKGGWWFRWGNGYCRAENLNAPERSKIKWNGSSRNVCKWCRLSIKPFKA